ncbi:hypothetical protein OIV83_002880 [Microbotryomycetes sp. JL201]|nr:hypothetical protein OIV83_002880 [Microbotryomycetes sp. JL201]
MALVSYGSDSDDDAHDSNFQSAPQQQQSAGAASKSSSSNASSSMSLPPPRSSMTAATSAPAPSTSSTGAAPSLPKPAVKKQKAPLRMVLDLPAPGAASSSTSPAGDDDSREPVKKKLKLGSSTGGGGLASLLPQPKNIAPARPAGSTLGAGANSSGASLAMGLPPPSTSTSNAGSGAGATEPSTAFVPYKVSNKGKAKASAPSVASASTDAAEEDEEEHRTPAVDFFGIGSVASTDASSNTKKPINAAAVSVGSNNFSAAPTVAEVKPPEPKKPTADDPYPGFTQLPSGEWVAKDQETYDKWMQALAQQQRQQAAQVPKGFEDSEVNKMGGIVDVTDEMQRAREAWAKKPDILGRPGQAEAEAEKEKALARLKVPAVGMGRARAKGQLSALLADAYSNRAELEERIAQAKANRKSAGNKYGF